jgi:hypothetical protein
MALRRLEGASLGRAPLHPLQVAAEAGVRPAGTPASASSVSTTATAIAQGRLRVLPRLDSINSFSVRQVPAHSKQLAGAPEPSLAAGPDTALRRR